MTTPADRLVNATLKLTGSVGTGTLGLRGLRGNLRGLRLGKTLLETVLTALLRRLRGLRLLDRLGLGRLRLWRLGLGRLRLWRPRLWRLRLWRPRLWRLRLWRLRLWRLRLWRLGLWRLGLWRLGRRRLLAGGGATVHRSDIDELDFPEGWWRFVAFEENPKGEKAKKQDVDGRAYDYARPEHP